MNLLPDGVPVPPQRYDHEHRKLTRCRCDFDDGNCAWKHCPQLRDGEPRATGCHCPLDLPPHASGDDDC